MSEQEKGFRRESLLLHYDELTAFVRRRVGVGGAADIIQETYLRFLGVLRAGGRIANPRAYLFRIAGNVTHDLARQERRRGPHVAPDEQQAEPADGNPDAERIVAARQRMAILDRAIDELPPRCREVFLLRRIEDLDAGEIADRLGISRNMVEKHLRHALAHCARRLDEAS